MTIATDEAVQMLQSRWTVKLMACGERIEWKSPDEKVGSWSFSLDDPPIDCVRYARRLGHVVDHPMTPIP